MRKIREYVTKGIQIIAVLESRLPCLSQSIFTVRAWRMTVFFSRDNTGAEGLHKIPNAEGWEDGPD